jgi:carbonic anhydrase/acetyltransferase-like protein (isoleucine patch superfamily)
MLIARNGQEPRIHSTAKVGLTAQIVGNVDIGADCYIDHNVVIESSGPPIEIEDGVIIFAGSVIRSVGGGSRPAFPFHIGQRTLVSPLCALAGCRIGRNCYVATGVVMLQGAVVGDGSRIGAGAIVHARTNVPENGRVGMRDVAAPTEDGFISTADVELAREAVARADFFETAFGAKAGDQTDPHEEVISKVLDEVHGWQDVPLA